MNKEALSEHLASDQLNDAIARLICDSEVTSEKNVIAIY